MRRKLQISEDCKCSWVVFLNNPYDFGWVPHNVMAGSLEVAIEEAKNQWRDLYNVEWFYGNEHLEEMEDVEVESFILTPYSDIAVWKVYKDSWINELAYEDSEALYT